MRIARVIAPLLTILAVACGGGSNPVTPSPSTTTTTTTTTGSTGTTGTTGTTTPSTGTNSGGLSASLSFTRAPLDLARIQSLTPLGNLNPPAHTLPTDHIYLFHHVGRESDAQYDVFAPADGVINNIERGQDDAVYIAATSTQTYYLGHMLIDSALTINSRITAGQRLGTTSPVSQALDLGLLNSTISVAFLAPARYSQNSLRSEPALKYFAEPLRTQLYSLVQSTPDNRDGQFNYDRAGTLSGNWFHETLSASGGQSIGPDAGPRHLAFVRDSVNPSVRVVSLGGTVGIAGVYPMDASDPDPTAITPASGPVTLHLSNQQQGKTGMLMVVTMTADARIRVQFQGNDQIYVR